MTCGGTRFYNLITASMKCLLIVPDKLEFSKSSWVKKHGMFNYLHSSANIVVLESCSNRGIGYHKILFTFSPSQWYL